MAKEAIIIGGSIAGLMCGIMLKHHGYKVTILEASASDSRHGYDAGIKIGPEVETFLEKHDDVKYDMVITCLPGVAIGIDGSPIPQRGQTIVNTSWGLFNSILRANFDGRVSKAVPVAPKPREGDGTAKYVNGVRVTHVQESEKGRVQVQSEDETGQARSPLEADIVVVADGSTSSMRSILLPEVERKYLGYMCWRGTVQEELIDEKWNKLYAEKTTFHFMKKSYLLNYTIPTDDGDLRPGKRLHNWIWYSNLAADSPELQETFTDIHGTTHRGTIARGLIQPALWTQKKELATTQLPAGLAAIVRASAAPFATKVYDVACPQTCFLNGKLFIVGDAQLTLRPNTGMGTTHAAHDCNRLEEVVRGELTPGQWEGAVLRWNAAQRRFAEAVVSFTLGTWVGTVWNGLVWVGLLFGQWVGVL